MNIGIRSIGRASLASLLVVGGAMIFATSGALTVRAGDTAAEIGKAAPAFSLADTEGKKHSLADFKGKVVVLEWFNPDCPFVKLQHTNGALKELPPRAEKDGVVWLAVNSGAPGMQGAGAERNRKAREEFAMTYPVLIDEDGTVGKAYGAKTSPHMFVIDKAGVLVYAGAIDNAPMGKVEGGGEKINYVEKALAAIGKGEKVATATSTPYGCNVKYAKGGYEKKS